EEAVTGLGCHIHAGNIEAPGAVDRRRVGLSHRLICRRGSETSDNNMRVRFGEHIPQGDACRAADEGERYGQDYAGDQLHRFLGCPDTLYNESRYRGGLVFSLQDSSDRALKRLNRRFARGGPYQTSLIVSSSTTV